MQNRKQDWPSIISDWSQSGISQVEYCRLHNVDVKQFYFNKYKQNKQRREKASLFIPVQLKSANFQSQSTNSHIKIRIRDEIELTVASDTETLNNVFKALGISSC